MKFYAEITNTAPKNRAEKAAQELAQKFHANLINSEQTRDNLIQHIQTEVNKINEEHPRCGEVETRNWNLHGQNDSLSIGDCSSLSFKEVKSELKSI